MGQFLAVGLSTTITISKSEVKKAELSIEQLQEKMKKELYFMPEIYLYDDSDDHYHIFRLKDEILHQQLIPFLKELYPYLYDKSQYSYFQDVLKKLKVMAPTEWLDWAEQKPEEAFQGDGYGTRDFFECGFHQVWINYDSVLLSMEGKIMMETYGRLFNFFKYTIMQSFKHFSIAGALRVYITG